MSPSPTFLPHRYESRLLTCAYEFPSSGVPLETHMGLTFACGARDSAPHDAVEEEISGAEVLLAPSRGHIRELSAAVFFGHLVRQKFCAPSVLVHASPANTSCKKRQKSETRNVGVASGRRQRRVSSRRLFRRHEEEKNARLVSHAREQSRVLSVRCRRNARGIRRPKLRKYNFGAESE